MKIKEDKYHYQGSWSANHYDNTDGGFTWRFWFIIAGLLFGLIGISSRLVFLTVVEQDFLRAQGDSRSVRDIKIPSPRGAILDRNGEVLALSSPVDSVWIDPQTFHPTAAQLQAFTQALKLSPTVLAERVVNNQSRRFLYIKRRIEPNIADRLKALSIPGVYFQQEYARYYPVGEVTAQMLGFTNIDDQGQEGLELAYDNWLTGTHGITRVRKDLKGRVIAELEDVRKPKPGGNLVLSIDRRIQYIAFRELQAAALEYDAIAGSVVVLDTHTNEVLAMVNWPSYNPNNRSDYKEDHYRNRAVTDLFEPGSTMKIFSALNAIDQGSYTTDTIVDTSPGWYNIGKYTMQDVRNNGKIPLSEVLRRSSNVGISRVTLDTPPESLWNTLHKLGFGQSTNTFFPGESSGVLSQRDRWPDITLATMSYGYGLSTTTLQLARAFSVIANHGELKPISLLKLDAPPEGEQLFEPDATDSLLLVMEQVVTQGAVKAKIPGYRVGGKTGTTQLLGPGGYQKNRHRAVFAGVAPVSNPRLVAVVVLDEPRAGQYYAAQVAAPVFSKIIAETLRILDIEPDNM